MYAKKIGIPLNFSSRSATGDETLRNNPICVPHDSVQKPESVPSDVDQEPGTAPSDVHQQPENAASDVHHEDTTNEESRQNEETQQVISNVLDSVRKMESESKHAISY
ncbi:hypothetical protein Hanom_Chr06g00547151 [Helianthus anomalus]